MNKYVGESEKAIREIFRKARLSAPSIIFFDEIDAIATKRGTDSEGNNVSDRMLCQLLNEMDGIEESGRVIVIAATNRPDILDNALLRPGRIDRILYVPLPNYDARLEILQIYTSKMPIDETVELSKIAEKLDGYTGAEVSLICKEAAMFGLEADINIAKLNSTHFNKAIDKVKPRLKKEDLQKYQAFTGEPIFSLQLKLKN
jgi:transitional endoplasmic reticulum ATPase